MKKISPHDQFFKELFSRKDHVADLIRYTLPVDIAKALDLQTLNLENASFVDDDLNQHFSDLVYTCSSKDNMINICLLFEHKSAPEKHISIQLNRYLSSAWHTCIKQAAPLVPIIPIVFYHGVQSWQPQSIAESMSHSGILFERYIPDFDFVFIDLAQYSWDTIKNELFDLASVKMGLLVFKYIFKPQELEQILQQFFEIGRAYFDDNKGIKFLETVLKYIYWSTDIKKEKMAEALTAITPKGRDLAMTTAEKLIEQGIQQGIQQGVQQGVREGLREGIELAVSLKFGAPGLGLIPEIRQLETLDQLKKVKDALHQYSSLESFRKILKTL